MAICSKVPQGTRKSRNVSNKSGRNGQGNTGIEKGERLGFSFGFGFNASLLEKI
jgi:hypothetical protein